MSKIKLAGGAPGNDVGAWPDAELLAAVRWRRGASPELLRAAREGDYHALAAACRPASAAAPRPVPHLLRACWSQGAFPAVPADLQFLNELRRLGSAPPAGKRSAAAVHGTAERLFETWLKTGDPAVGVAPLDVSPAVLLMLLDWLPEFGPQLSPVMYGKAWRLLLSAALCSSPAAAPVGEPDQILVQYGELPWRLANFFADVQGADKLRKQGAVVLNQELTERTDRMGTPHAEFIQRLPWWLASLVRVTREAQGLGRKLWDDDAADQLRNLVERIAPLCRGDGSLALSRAAVDGPEVLIREAFECTGWPEAENALRVLLASRGPARQGKSRRSTRPAPGPCLAPVVQSDWASLACLRTGWNSTDDLIAVAHAESVPSLEFAAAGAQILHGVWELRVLREGQPVPVSGTWSCTCWQSDEDSDYLELQYFEPGVVRIDRQILLARTGRFALLADAITELAPGRVDVELRLPLAPGVAVESRTADRELCLRQAGVAVRVFPLALPQQRVHSTPGNFTHESNHLVLRQAVRGSGLYAPLLFDWDPDRTAEPAQWRTLTVSEERRILKPDEAAGHRVRIGPQQLLIYRALVRTTEARAVLGHHTRNETVIGSVTPEGDINPIMMVE